MIPGRYIAEWKQEVLWPEDTQVELDLLITRAIIAIFSDDYLRDTLAFRGGTALHKLFMRTGARFSEDIDLVQINPGPIGPVVDRLREILGFIESTRINVDRNIHMTTLHYRFVGESSMAPLMKLKIEINCREHKNVYPYIKKPVRMKNSWFNGETNVVTYQPEELLGTKLRALYQRSKGRDLFDLWYALTHLAPDAERLLTTFKKYTQNTGLEIAKTDFLKNVKLKVQNRDFRNDINGLLRPGLLYDIDQAYELIINALILKI